jgi:hypothetical protein
MSPEKDKDKTIICERVNFLSEYRQVQNKLKKEREDDIDELYELVNLSRDDD